MQRIFAALVWTVLGTSPALAQDAKLAARLGPDAAAWQVAPYQGQIDAVPIDGGGRPASAVGPNGLVLTARAPVQKDTEILVRFRITLPKGQGSGLTLVAGQKKAIGMTPGRRLSPAGPPAGRPPQASSPPATASTW